MISATYSGPNVALRGQRAILQPAEGQLRVLAQFDNVALGPAYAVGWREFGVHEFDLVLSDQVALSRERRHRQERGVQAREVILADPAAPDYEAQTAEFLAEVGGAVSRRLAR